MKTCFKGLGALLLVLAFCDFASAVPINGVVSFGGYLVAREGGVGQDWTNATQFGWILADWEQHTGDFSGVWFQGSAITRDLRITDTAPFAYWSMGTEGGAIAQFEVTSITFDIAPNSFGVHGDGVAFLTGFDPTYASWQIGGQPFSVPELGLYSAGATFTASGVAVPDAGVTASLLVFSLGALVLGRRRMAQPNVAEARHGL